MIIKKSRNEERKVRHQRVRKKVFGTDEKPRLVVFKSLKHIYAQIVDDLQGHTLTDSNTLQEEVRVQIDEKMSRKDAARVVGENIARKALEKGIETVVFDRAGYKYHGIVAALADGARTKGLKF